ncbi:MAG: hypothetical protein HC921_13970 [Synechococcaceae cyanobacterium SM2_3_1]|nr:hypothetical protein [Synechococcaceae cyanobacterium SM2_3_1]
MDPSVLQEKLGLSGTTLLSLRKDGTLIQGIHYSEINCRLLLYNLPLMIDWLVNRQDPQAHQRAIETFQAGLLSNQPKPRGRHKISRKGKAVPPD